MGFTLVQGQSHELPSAKELLDALPRVPQFVVCDRGYSSEKFRDAVWEMGSRPVVPTKRNEATLSCPAWAYNNRNCVERLFARLKEWRAFATRYEKTASAFAAVTAIAATWDWIKNSKR